MEPKDYKTRIEQKSWVADDDSIYLPDDFDPEWDAVEWWSNKYIASEQIRNAFEDPDVTIGDIDAYGNEVCIYLLLDEPQALDEPNFPTHTNRRLGTMAAIRFRQQGIDTSQWTITNLLDEAEQQFDNAHGAYYVRDDPLAFEEHLGDALCYMLLALDKVLTEAEQ